MARASTTTIEYKDNSGTSTFAFSIDGGPLRTLTYHGGFVALEAVPIEVTLSVEDFEWLITESDRWLALVTRYLKPPTLDPQVFSLEFAIGAKVGPLWHATARGTYRNIADTSLTIGFHTVVELGTIKVVFETRQAGTIPLSAFQDRVTISRDLIAAINTGKRLPAA